MARDSGTTGAARDFGSDRWRPRRQRAPGPPARSTSPAARRSLIHPRIRLTRSSTCWTDNRGPGATRWMSASPRSLPSTSSLSLTGRRRSRASSTRARRRGASAPKKCAWKPRRTAADRTAKFWFRNTTSAPGELTYQREEQRFNLRQVTHLRLTIVPEQERLRHGDAYSAPALRLSGLELQRKFENTGPLGWTVPASWTVNSAGC